MPSVSSSSSSAPCWPFAAPLTRPSEATATKDLAQVFKSQLVVRHDLRMYDTSEDERRVSNATLRALRGASIEDNGGAAG